MLKKRNVRIIIAGLCLSYRDKNFLSMKISGIWNFLINVMKTNVSSSLKNFVKTFINKF